MVRVCPHCGSNDIDEDATRGDATCVECGTVLEESIVVAENQFQERAGGSGHTLVGQFVSMERQAHSLQGVPGLVSQESRELTFQKGRRLIEEIASQLRINQFCIDTSYNFFKMCVIKNLTRGRIRSHVVAACMYMTCRLENTPHLLLDFSDVTQVNVFDLGRTLSFLSRSLRINLPSTDPCLYVMRFACLLEFGDVQKEVVTLATRLVERMKRDWISTGRRPTGLCGAALLIAARAYNFNRSIADVVRVVHISETVVRKRLEEFSQTPSGALTIDEFQVVDLDQSEDPPAFREARRKAQQALLEKEQQMAEKMTGDVHLMEAEVEKALEQKRRDKFKGSPYAKELTGVDQIDDVGKMEAAFVNDQIMQSVYEAADATEQPSSSHFSQYGPTLQSLGIRGEGPVERFFEPPPLPTADNENGDLNLEGIDDDEIDSYILSNAESAIKEKFWMKVNGEHLKEMDRRKREREEAELKDPDIKKKRRKASSNGNRKDQENGPAPSTAAEAIEKVIQEKKLSNKVNYDILKEIDHAMPGVSDELIIKPIPTFEPSILIKRERMLAKKNCHGANAGRLNILREALKVEGNNEGVKLDPKDEPKEAKPCTPFRKRFQKPRPFVKSLVKPEVLPLVKPEVQASEASAAKTDVCNSQQAVKASTKINMKTVLPLVKSPVEVKDLEKTTPDAELNEASTSTAPELEVIGVKQKPIGRLQKRKHMGPEIMPKPEISSPIKVVPLSKEQEIEKKEEAASVRSEVPVKAEDVPKLPSNISVKLEVKPSGPKLLSRRIQVRPLISNVKK